MKRFTYLKAFFSPFRRPKLKWYVGPIAVGTPYFYPRRTIKDPDKPGYLKFVPKRIGFDFVDLGWKSKWTATDYRFEWAPLISFVFFKWQIAVTFVAPEQDHYWACWLYYNYNTDKTKSRQERITQCREEFPCKWKVTRNGITKTVDYYDVVLKKRKA
jgi:hypothetical protein